jgi:hypothetical protein
VYLWAFGNVFVVHLETWQSKKLFKTNHISYYYPFESVYTAGNSTPSHVGYNRTKLISDNCLMEYDSHPFVLTVLSSVVHLFLMLLDGLFNI